MSPRVKRILAVISFLLISLVVAGGFWMYHLMGEPLYRPGMARAERGQRAPLAPPPQPDDPNLWQMEDGIELYHFSEGSGTPILFLHGGPGFPVHDVPAGLERLAREYEIHFYDQRGSGRSTKPFDRFTSSNFYQNMMVLDRALGLATQIADIERIRRILGRDTLILIGHSFGGFLASLYAAEFPERVEAMVLVAPADLVVFPPKDGDIFEIIRNRLPSHLKEEYAGFTETYTDFSTVFTKSEKELAGINREFGRFFMLAAGEDPKNGLAELEAAANGGWMVTAIYFGLGKKHDYRDALRAIDSPALIIHGSNDLQPESVSRSYADLLANARMEVIPAAGHFIMADQPNEFAKLVGAFLRRPGSE